MGCQQSKDFQEKKSRSCVPSNRQTVKNLASHLEQILDANGNHLIGQFPLDSAYVHLDLSSKHVLYAEKDRLTLIDLDSMKVEHQIVSSNRFLVQDIVWSTFRNRFFILTTNCLHQAQIEPFRLTSIEQIQFLDEGHLQSYMTIDGKDLLINRSFGRDLRQFSLTNFKFVRKIRLHDDRVDVRVTTIQLNSKKILAVTIDIDQQQMIDFFSLNADRWIRRISLGSNEHIFYPIDLHSNGLWFAKTLKPSVNIGHCLISSDGQINRLTLFSNQDNFIRSFKISPDQKHVLIARQYRLELYSFSD